MTTVIRPATAADQSTIKSIVRAARIAPYGLDWPRFLVAEDGGRLVGVGQVKPHGDGSRELASLAVIPEYQGQGLGSSLIQSLLAREPGPVYLFCRDELESYYARFDFEVVGRRELPPIMARLHRLANLFAPLGSLFLGQSFRIIAMRREPGNNSTSDQS
jgi:N-acetylglutamate synthase-like GNAT family acetyltransferase